MDSGSMVIGCWCGGVVDGSKRKKNKVQICVVCSMVHIKLNQQNPTHFMLSCTLLASRPFLPLRSLVIATVCGGVCNVCVMVGRPNGFVGEVAFC